MDEKKPKILVVDDSHETLKLLENILGGKGYSLKLVDTGKEALREFSKVSYDLILLDIQMPDISGFELCNYAKQSKKNNQAPILFVTASNDIQSVVKGFEIGGSDYIKKPYNKRELIARVETQIRLKKSQDTINKYVKDLEEKNKFIVDSIVFAEKIQKSLLPSEQSIKELIPESFIFFRPKDIVSGDFYWIKKSKDTILLAAADCTGHGVPGAFMSSLGISLLNEVTVNGETDPGKILDRLTQRIQSNFHLSEDHFDAVIGMDISLAGINVHNMELQYAGAANPLLIVRNGDIIELKANTKSISLFDREQKFITTKMSIEAGDMIFHRTDGIIDQFGKDNLNKMKSKMFRSILLKISKMPVKKQYDTLEAEFLSWKGKTEQTDDILVIGCRI